MTDVSKLTAAPPARYSVAQRRHYHGNFFIYLALNPRRSRVQQAEQIGRQRRLLRDVHATHAAATQRQNLLTDKRRQGVTLSFTQRSSSLVTKNANTWPHKNSPSRSTTRSENVIIRLFFETTTTNPLVALFGWPLRNQINPFNPRWIN